MNDEDIRDRWCRDMLETSNRQADPDDALTEATLEQAITRIRESAQGRGERLVLNPTHVQILDADQAATFLRTRQGAEVHAPEVASNAERYAWFDESPELTDEDLDLLYDILVSPEWSQVVTCHRDGWRRICTKRARKLRKRGEDVRWLPEYDSHAWIPPHLRQEH